MIGHSGYPFKKLLPSPRPTKRRRTRTPEEEENRFHIDDLPEDTLLEILRRLPGNRERASAACVSKRWLSLVSSILLVSDDEPPFTTLLAYSSASDVALAAATAKANFTSGGLKRLFIEADISPRLTNNGVIYAARGSPSTLTSLSLSGAAFFTDDALREIARCCPFLLKLELRKCPVITDGSLHAIADGCRKLTSLTLDNLRQVGDAGLLTVGRHCRRLESISIRRCPLVGDRGVLSLLVSSTPSTLTLQYLDISNVSLAVIGHYGNSITSLVLRGLKQVNEKGFWVMGNARGLKRLKSMEIAVCCDGATDVGVEAVTKWSPHLRKIRLERCPRFSDVGLVSIAKSTTSLESLELVECEGITIAGVRNAVASAKSLRSLHLAGCEGIGDRGISGELETRGGSIRSVSVKDCRFFGDLCLKWMMLTAALENVDLLGSVGVTKEGLLDVVEMDRDLGFARVNLSGCAAVVDDSVVSAISRVHGRSLRVLNLAGCEKVTDSSVVEICHSCEVLEEVDLSRSAVTDIGIGELVTLGTPLLRVISLSGCSEVSDDGLAFLSSAAEGRLLGVDVRHCRRISSSAARDFEKRMEGCEVIW